MVVSLLMVFSIMRITYDDKRCQRMA